MSRARYIVRLEGRRMSRWVEAHANNEGAARMQVAQRSRRRGEKIVEVRRVSASKSPENAGARERRIRTSRVETKRLRDAAGRGYSYPPRSSYQFLGAGPWRVLLRDKKGRSFAWRSGLTYNQARAARKAARAANYRDPRVARQGVSK